VSFDANKALERARIGERIAEERVPRSPYHASFRALSDAFESFAGGDSGRRIVVFVDDLDRCLPERALDVLESMKLFFDLDGFVFVVGLDREIVQEVVETKYRRRETADGGTGGVRFSGEEYVKKIFQLPFPLAPVPLAELHTFLEAAYELGRVAG
jgi:KAP family P-loop domain